MATIGMGKMPLKIMTIAPSPKASAATARCKMTGRFRQTYMMTRDKAMAATQPMISFSKSANTAPTITLPKNRRIISDSATEALTYNACRTIEASTTAQPVVAATSLSSSLNITIKRKVETQVNIFWLDLR